MTEQAEKKRVAENEWVEAHYPKAAGPEAGVLTEVLTPGHAAAAGAGPLKVKYRGTEVHYVGDVLGREGPPISPLTFVSGEGGAPGFLDTSVAFEVEPGKTKINTGLDSVIAGMTPGERLVAVVPASLAYKGAGLYTPDVPGKKRLVISPNSVVVYEVEAEK